MTKPVVADYTGDLYNKDAILQYLLPDDVSPLDKVEAEKFVQGRVKSLKDIVEVHFEIEKDDTLKTEKWTCPVTSKELGPNVKAVFIVPCGHAFSREALEVMKDVNNCPSCGSPFESRDIIPILPYTEADKNAVIERMETLKNLGLTHSLKKASGSKKRKANGNIKADGDSKPEALENGATAAGESTHANKNGNQHLHTINTKTSSGIRNTATAGITAKVLEEEEAKKKRRLQTGENENIRSLYKKGDSQVKDVDFMTRGFSIPANKGR